MNLSARILATLLVAGAGALLAACNPEQGQAGSSTPTTTAPSTTASAPTSGAATPTSQASPASTVTKTVTAPATAVSGVVLTPSGSELGPGAGGPVDVPKQHPCPGLIPSGWTGQCGTVATAGGTLAWETASHPVGSSQPDAQQFQVKLFTYSDSAGAWVPQLRAVDTEGAWTGITVRGADLTGDGKPEVLVAFRYRGTGDMLGLNIVHYQQGGSPAVIAHPDQLYHGAAIVGTQKIDEYQAEYPNNEPNCCPPYFRHRVIRWDGTNYRAEQLSNAADIPSGSL